MQQPNQADLLQEDDYSDDLHNFQPLPDQDYVEQPLPMPDHSGYDEQQVAPAFQGKKLVSCGAKFHNPNRASENFKQSVKSSGKGSQKLAGDPTKQVAIRDSVPFDQYDEGQDENDYEDQQYSYNQASQHGWKPEVEGGAAIADLKCEEHIFNNEEDQYENEFFAASEAKEDNQAEEGSLERLVRSMNSKEDKPKEAPVLSLSDVDDNIKTSQMALGLEAAKPPPAPLPEGVTMMEKDPIPEIVNIYDEAQRSKAIIMEQINAQDIQLKKHERKIGQYILGKTIGEGTFGKVKIGMHILTKSKVAVKILEKSKIVDVADVERVSREIHILKIVQHPHVVQLYEIIETPKKLYLIMEYASGGELFDYIVKHQRVQEKEACKFFQQLLSGIEYISRLNIVHRDLKPENLLLDFDKGIKIVDFGLSNTYKTGELLKTACGSPCYAAPEMIAGKKYNGTNVDIWSCGVILFALICGYLPFEDPNTSNLYKKILSADFQTPNYVSDEAKDLFQCILNTDPEKRYTIEQIRNHPWFNLVSCEAKFKGVKRAEVGLDPVPIDTNILDTMQSKYQIDKEYAKKCIQANKHNHISATYYLLLKDLIRRGEKSIADVRSPDYHPDLLIRNDQGLRQEKLRDKLENASIQEDEGNAQDVENGTGQPSNFDEEDSQKPKAEATPVQQSKKDEPSIQDTQKVEKEPRTKSTQPQRLRKIADGLLEFERYADRKKRLQSINLKKENEEKLNNMKLQLSQNQIAEDIMSNGGMALIQRGISPVAGNYNYPDTLSFDQVDQSMAYNYDYRSIGREQSPSLSPRSLRLNAQKGSMSTQYGNFLYQVEAKQFPKNGMVEEGNGPNRQQLDQYQLSALKNQLHIQALQQASNNASTAPNPNISQMNNAKQLHKQLQQLYLNKKKKQPSSTGSKATEETLLKNLVNMSQGKAPQQQPKSKANLTKVQLLQQNYLKQPAQISKKTSNSGGQNFSTIQTAIDSLQQNQQSLFASGNQKAKGKGSIQPFRAPGPGQMGASGPFNQSKLGSNGSASIGGGGGQPDLLSSSLGGFNPTSSSNNQYMFPATQQFNTLQQQLQDKMMSPNNEQLQNAMGNTQNPRNTMFATTHSSFLNGAANSSMNNGSRIGALKQNVANAKAAKRTKNATVIGSGSLGPGGGIFSPKNLPTNSFGFGFGPTSSIMQNNSIITPQNHLEQLEINPQRPTNLFTIDHQDLITQSAQKQNANLSSQLLNSLNPNSNALMQQQLLQQQMLANSLSAGSKQNSQPSTLSPQNQQSRQNNRASQNKRQSSISGAVPARQQSNPKMKRGQNEIQSQQSYQSNKALFKRRRDNSKTNKNKSASKQAAQQYGTLQHNTGDQGNRSFNLTSTTHSMHPRGGKAEKVNSSDLMNRSALNSQKKIATRNGASKSHQTQGRNTIAAQRNFQPQNFAGLAEANLNIQNLNLNFNNLLTQIPQGLINPVQVQGAVTTKNENLFSPMGQPVNKKQQGQPVGQQMPLLKSQQPQLNSQDPNWNLNQLTNQMLQKQQQQQRDASQEAVMSQSSILAQRNNTSTNLEMKKHFSRSKASRGGGDNSEVMMMMNSMSENSKQSEQPPRKQHKNNSFSIQNTASSNKSRSKQVSMMQQQLINNSSNYQTRGDTLSEVKAPKEPAKKLQLNNRLMMAPANPSNHNSQAKTTKNYQQKGGPHLLLQNFHGNGYPPQLQQMNLQNIPPSQHPSAQTQAAFLQIAQNTKKPLKTPQHNATTMMAGQFDQQ